MFRAGVVHTLSSLESVCVVAQGASGEDALRIVASGDLDILIIDIDNPGCGQEFIDSVRRMAPTVRIIVLTRSERMEDVMAALRGGARAYLLKDVGSDGLFDAIRLVASGEVYLVPSLGARFLSPLARARLRAPRTDTLACRLTEREEEVLVEVSLGSTNKEVAAKLKVTERTIKFHMTTIMQKLGVRNRVEALEAYRKRSIGLQSAR